MDADALEYVGFWLRVVASLVDTFLICLLTLPVLSWVYGPAYWSSGKFIHGPADFLISWVLPAAAVVLFWVTRQSTPGKMIISARVVDADTGATASTGQYVGRYLGYFLSSLPMGLGFLWVAFDPRKQGWHDKLARTVVVRMKIRSPTPVVFSQRR